MFNSIVDNYGFVYYFDPIRISVSNISFVSLLTIWNEYIGQASFPRVNVRCLKTSALCRTFGSHF